ncbi:Ras family protein [Ancylostoma ceylanicum]|uniref:Ras family protein n=1 Tax=Ancylostoma ceylanicum TaxID=53326 RepID=A0A0D6L617_9BILA|nr:Ras family protein [Ancylostoma ceylanicum]
MKRTDRKDTRKTLARSKSAARPRPPNAGRDMTRRPYEITVIVLGATRVGKSALVSQFLWEGFVSDYKPTVEEFNWIEYELGEGSALMLQVVFSIDDASSFEEAKKIIEEIEQERNKKVPIVLVANKCDLHEDVMDWKARGSHQYAYTKSIPIVECSAKRQPEVAEAFKELLERLRDENRIGITNMRKRRQSMPSTRAYSGIDVADVERLKGKQKSNCVIS